MTTHSLVQLMPPIQRSNLSLVSMQLFHRVYRESRARRKSTMCRVDAACQVILETICLLVHLSAAFEWANKSPFRFGITGILIRCRYSLLLLLDGSERWVLLLLLLLLLKVWQVLGLRLRLRLRLSMLLRGGGVILRWPIER